MGNLTTTEIDQDLPKMVIQEALQKSYPLTKDLALDLSEIAIASEISSREILVTRFRVLSKDEQGRSVHLEVLSQKANGDVFFSGKIKAICTA